MSWTRGATLTAAAAAPFVGKAQAQTPPPIPDWLREHSAMAAWDAPTRGLELLLNARLAPEPGSRG
jgi:hypothetical protein